MPTQTPHLTQLPEAASAERTTTAPMLPPGPHRPLTPSMPLPASPTSSPHSSAFLFKEDRYSSTSEEESEMDEVTFTHSKTNGTFSDCHAKRPTSTPTPSDYTTQGDPDGHEDEIEINEAHVRNPNYKGKNYDPNFAQNRLKATNNNTNTSKNQNNNTSSYGPSGQHSNNTLGYGYSKSNQQEKPVNVSVTLHGLVSKDQL